MQPKPITAELEAAFNKLAEEWEKETALDSFRAIKIRHPAFRRVVETWGGHPGAALALNLQRSG